jgi:hypothetical protein
LPVGVIPVTTVITEIQYGPRERAEVRLLDGSSREVAVDMSGSARATFEALLRADELPMRQRLLAGLDREFDGWARNLCVVTESFDAWLRAQVTAEISQLSQIHRTEFIDPVHRASRQLSQSFQHFRNRLSERTLAALGVPLRTTEPELHPVDPASPDIGVGKIFDHTWELLSPIVPMVLVKGVVKRHFARKIEYIVFMNLSRLVSQWEEIVRGELLRLGKQTLARLDSLVDTIEKLLASAGAEAPKIREDLRRLQELIRQNG